MLSQLFEVKEAKESSQISIWETGINNTDRQAISIRVSAPSSFFPKRNNESAPEISFKLLKHNP